MSLYLQLLEKLPVLDLRWPEERQAQWWIWLEEIIDGLNRPCMTNRRTGYKDKTGRAIREGDTVEGCFGAPWDEGVPVSLTFKVAKRGQRWFCEGIETNYHDDYLNNFHFLKVANPAKGLAPAF